MRQLFAGLMLVILTVFTSCKNNDEEEVSSKYPATIESVLWTGMNTTTASVCNVTFSTSADKGQFCVISIAGFEKEESGNFEGRYTYNSQTGTATVNLKETAGGPTIATLQFDESGKNLNVSFTTTGVNLGKFTLAPAIYPSLIGGTWVSNDPKIPVTAVLDSYSTAKGAACEIVALGGAMKLSGTYSYGDSSGKGTLTVTTTDGTKYEGTLEYNSDHSLTCKIPALENILTADGIKLNRELNI